MPGTMAGCAIGWKTFAIGAKIAATVWKIAATGRKTCAIVATIGVTGGDDRKAPAARARREAAERERLGVGPQTH